MAADLPEYFQSLEPGEKFTFSCHRGVECFTECCRQLDLALTPYDVLRLKNRLQMHSGRFLEQYVIVEVDERNPFPLCYLTMVDDGRASCVFVSSAGCTVYSDRPGACRCYPVGRGASRTAAGAVKEQFVLIREPHCQGFQQPLEQDIETFFRDQGLGPYNRFNDALMELLQHEQVHQGFRPSRQQQELFILALYNLDQFRQELADGRLQMSQPSGPRELQAMAGDDEELLLYGIRFLIREFFAS